MGIMARLRRLDERVGALREGESRRDYIARRASGPWLRYENPHVYREVVELHDRVTALEAKLAAIEAGK
jgi:hypothetical protein